jgi:hypothetical protein
MPAAKNAKTKAKILQAAICHQDGAGLMMAESAIPLQNSVTLRQKGANRRGSVIMLLQCRRRKLRYQSA